MTKAVFFLVVAAGAAGARTAPRVEVVAGNQAPPVEQFAARELSRYLNVLFPLPAKTPVPYRFLVGSARTNPNIPPTVRRRLARLSDQGILFEPLPGGTGLVVGGGSPQATLWAVYDLVERWGVRYLLHGDVLPPPSPFRPLRLSLTREPVFRIRQWRVVNEFAVGPASWGMADYRPVLDQLAKLRFNRILAYVWPHQPFLDYASGGISRRSSSMFFGFRFPITDDMPGRGLFGSESEFHNPDLPPGADYRATYQAARNHLTALMAYARERGMSCVLGLTASEFPPEFSPLFKNAQTIHQVGKQTIIPGSETAPNDPALLQLARSVLDSAVRTYPDAEALDLGMQEWRQWTGQAQRAWNALDGKYGLGGPKALDGILHAARNRENYYGADRAEAEVRGDVVSIYFYDLLLSQRGSLFRNPKIVLDSVAEELFPYLSRMAPWAGETLNSVDYTPARILRRRASLQRVQSGSLASALIYTLHDDNIGILPQLETGSLHALNAELRRNGWSGFSTRYWLIGDQDPCVAYLSKSAWDVAATPEAVYRDQLSAVCGEECVQPMLSAFAELEAATRDLELHALGLAFPIPGMAMKFWKPAPLPSQFATTRDHYSTALGLVQTVLAKRPADPTQYLTYFAGRSQFGILYFDMIEQLQRGAAAEAKGDRAGARRAAERALALAKEAIECYARVARDQSDRGTIAVLAEYVYRPLKEKVATLSVERPS